MSKIQEKVSYDAIIFFFVFLHSQLINSDVTYALFVLVNIDLFLFLKLGALKVAHPVQGAHCGGGAQWIFEGSLHAESFACFEHPMMSRNPGKNILITPLAQILFFLLQTFSSDSQLLIWSKSCIFTFCPN